MSKVIIISGKQGSGKTTLMGELARSLGLQNMFPVDLIFADTIYKIHDFAIKLLKQRGIERNLVKDGFLLQFLGTEWGRKTIDENVWVNCLKGEMANWEKDLPKEDLIFLISDCRFQNEFDGIPDAFTVRLEASTEVRKERCSQWRENDTHPSEIDLDGYAKQGKFTCYIDTEKSKSEVAEAISAALLIWGLDKGIKGLGYEEVAKKYYV